VAAVCTTEDGGCGQGGLFGGLSEMCWKIADETDSYEHEWEVEQ